MRLRVVGGLCNRLRALLSYKRGRDHLDVVWEPVHEVTNARFLEYFEPISGITFHDSGPWDHESFEPEARKPPMWELLHPAARVKAVVEGLQQAIGEPYIQIHVRRMEINHLAVEYCGRITTDEEFLAFVKRHPNRPIYISCDNRETQARLAEGFESIGRQVWLPPFLLVGKEEAPRGWGYRNASMLQSVVNMYMGAGSYAFMGSIASSGAWTIQTLRELRGAK